MRSQSITDAELREFKASFRLMGSLGLLAIPAYEFKNDEEWAAHFNCDVAELAQPSV
jgi:hypothetical protein